MIATALIKYDQKYFEEFYSETVKYRLKWRRYALGIAIFEMIAGVAILIGSHLIVKSQLGFIFGVFAVCSGFYCLYESLTHRKKWMNQRLANLPIDKLVKLQFYDDSLEIISNNSEGVLKYSAFIDYKTTPNGMFLVPDSGIAIYVPSDSIEPRDMVPSIQDALKSNIGQR